MDDEFRDGEHKEEIRVEGERPVGAEGEFTDRVERERPVEIERDERRSSSWVIPLLAALALTVAGLAIWNPLSRRGPAPIGPEPTRITRRVNPARRMEPARQVPTKRLPGAAATSMRDIRRTINRAQEAVRDNDWAMARRESTRLGTLWARFKPQTSGLRPAFDTASFDATYAKLQADVNLKNRGMTMRDLGRLESLLRGL